MTKYMLSFDDVTNRFKRLSNALYNSTSDYFSFTSNTSIGSILNQGKLNVRSDSDTSQFYLGCYSNSDNIHPVINFYRKRNSGDSVVNGDYLGGLYWWIHLDDGSQQSTKIYAKYVGNSTTYLTRLIFDVSGSEALMLDENKGLRLYNSSGNTVTLKSSGGNWTFTLPANDGDANQFLITDGSGTSSWHDVTSDLIPDFSTEVNQLIQDYFSAMTDYSFDLDDTGSTTVDVGIDLTSRIIFVYENGVMKREGASYDFVKSGTEIVFNYTVKNSWVKVTVSDVGVNEYGFDVDNVGQTVFNTGVSLSGKRITVLENGVHKREGVSYDFTKSGTSVTFNYTVKNSWVLIIVYI